MTNNSKFFSTEKRKKYLMETSNKLTLFQKMLNNVNTYDLIFETHCFVRELWCLFFLDRSFSRNGSSLGVKSRTKPVDALEWRSDRKLSS